MLRQASRLSATRDKCKVLQEHATLIGLNQAWGSAETFLEKLISKLRYQGLVRIVRQTRRQTRRRVFRKKEHYV